MLSIKVENLSKAYQLGEIGTGTLSRDLERWFAKVSGKEDPFLKIGETNDRTSKGSSDVIWSLKDINFEIQEGDAVGIIGRNGAGKSTLLKILSRVTSPTTGEIKIKGRIASLLEVGTGFHPELTGRENIFLNGAILGMRKKEITRKFDAIVDFAGVERYIGTPVKRYSSGMYVRLAFAVAAYLESEILIVDEVLAVGDGEFQKKCLSKMGEVSKEEGRTVLFVSHNMGSVLALCNKGIFLNKGTIALNGEMELVVNHYLESSINFDENRKRQGSKEGLISDIYLVDINGKRVHDIIIGDTPITLVVEFEFQKKKDCKVYFEVGMYDAFNSCHLFLDSRYQNKYIKPVLGQKQKIIIEISKDYYPKVSTYYFNVCLDSTEGYIDYIQNALSFHLLDGLFYKDGSSQHSYSLSIVKHKITICN